MVEDKTDLKAYEKEYNLWVEKLDLFNKWITDSRLSKTQERRWDNRAEDFVKRPIPTVDDHMFLRKLIEIADLGPDTTVLDIGSGGGHLSIALAPYVKSVLGIDVSGNMVKHATELAYEHGIRNVSFEHKDWSEMSSDDPLISNSFDIVFAHMTPAVGTANDFVRMMDICKKYLFMTKPVRRHNPVAENLWKRVGVNPPVTSADKDIVCAFILGWQRGFSPELFYENRTWADTMTVDEAVEKYRNEFSYVDLKFDEQIVRDYFQSVSEDGIVDDATYAEIATIYWSVRK